MPLLFFQGIDPPSHDSLVQLSDVVLGSVVPELEEPRTLMVIISRVDHNWLWVLDCHDVDPTLTRNASTG